MESETKTMSGFPALLACDVFEEEIASLLAQTGIPMPRVIRWLEMGLHDHPSDLRAKVQEVIAEIETDPEVGIILLAYGQCGNGLSGVRAGRCPLVLPRAHDCISILLGGIDPHANALKDEPGTYFYSPGWIRGKRVPGPDRWEQIKQTYTERYPDDPELVLELMDVDRELFQHHRRAAYIDITNNSEAESYCRDCARHLGWDFVRMRGDASFLRDLLSGNHSPARFLIAQAGEVLSPDPGGSTIQI